MKKIISLLLCAVLIFSVFSVGAGASFNSLLETEADIVLLVNTDSETVIFDKNADKRSAPASLTKIVTCMLVLENCQDLSQTVTAKRSSLDGLYAMNAATVGILAGEQLSVMDLLKCLMIPSAADAANILADFIGGDIPSFVNMMNDFAARLGCADTHFVNAHGLDEGEGSYTTANDLYKITKYALQNQTFKEITSTVYAQIAPTAKYPHVRNLWQTNKMMRKEYSDYYAPYISGVKTGHTSKAGQCVISTASKNGYNYMLIVMNAPQYDIDGDGVEENVAFTDSRKIYEWAFKNIVLTKVTASTDVVTVVGVELSLDADHIRLVPAQEISALVPSGTNTGSLVIRPIEEATPKTVKAPVRKGDVLGKAEILYGDAVVATVDLVAAEDVQRSSLLWIWSGVKSALTSWVFKSLFIIAAVLILIYILLIIRRNYIRKKRRKIKMIKG